MSIDVEAAIQFVLALAGSVILALAVVLLSMVGIAIRLKSSEQTSFLDPPI